MHSSITTEIGPSIEVHFDATVSYPTFDDALAAAHTLNTQRFIDKFSQVAEFYHYRQQWKENYKIAEEQISELMQAGLGITNSIQYPNGTTVHVTNYLNGTVVTTSTQTSTDTPTETKELDAPEIATHTEL